MNLSTVNLSTFIFSAYLRNWTSVHFKTHLILIINTWNSYKSPLVFEIFFVTLAPAYLPKTSPAAPPPTPPIMLNPEPTNPRNDRLAKPIIDLKHKNNTTLRSYCYLVHRYSWRGLYVLSFANQSSQNQEWMTLIPVSVLYTAGNSGFRGFLRHDCSHSGIHNFQIAIGSGEILIKNTDTFDFMCKVLAFWM